jgi:hypothetical protein
MKRPFGLADGLVLAAAIGAGLAANRTSWPGLVLRWRHSPDAHRTIEYGLELVCPYLVTGTLAALAMRLRGPRPRLLRLLRQPGTVACVVALAALLPVLCRMAGPWTGGRFFQFTEHVVGPPGGREHPDVFHGHPRYLSSAWGIVFSGNRIGFAVAGAWFALFASGRWRSEASWIDRLGRAMGWAWIVLTVVFWLRCYSV